MSTHITSSNSVTLHICDGCRNVVIPPCKDSDDGQHEWRCFDHWGHPTGEQDCQHPYCGALRHHPNERHSQAHFEGHRAWLEDGGGDCWCVNRNWPDPATGGEG